MEIEPGLNSAPKYGAFYLEVDPTAEWVEVPHIFYKPYKNKFPSKVFFVDPVGTRIGINLLKFKNNGYLCHGMHNIVEHYELPHGGWLKVKYYEGEDFFMEVQDRNLQNVFYPVPKQTFPHEVLYVPDDYFSLSLDWDSMTQCKLELTHQATPNNLNLPANFVNDLLLLGIPKSIEIQDEVREKFKCKVRWEKRDREAEAYLGGEWERLCTKHGLKEGSTVVLAIDEENHAL